MTLLPRWFAALLAAGTAFVAGAGLSSLALGIAGVWGLALPLVVGVLAGAGGAWLGWRCGGDGGHAGAVAAVVLAVAFVVANWSFASASVMLERDPGLYVNGARWLVRDGSLLVDARVGPFADEPALEFVSVGMYDLDGDQLEFQSNHLTSSVLALGYDAAGVGGLMRVSLVLVAGGLLAVYAVAVRVTGRAGGGLFVLAALGLSLPFVSVARDAFSEPLLLLFLWTGLWLWTVAVDRGARAAALASGLCLGACLAARIDAAVLLVPVPIALVAADRRLVRPFLWGVVPGAAMVLADVLLRSRGYLGDLGVEIAAAYGLLAAVSVGAVVAARRGWRPPATLPSWWRPAAAAAVVVGLLLLWFVRPHVQEARAGDSELVAALQAAEGDEIDGTRRYHELSMVWQAWYLGVPLMGAAVAGAGVVLLRRIERALVLPWLVLAAGTGLYLLRPAIAPDHIWAMRRFVPAGLPLFCILAVLAAVSSLRRFAVVGVLALVPIGLRTFEVWEFREQEGFVALVEEACDVVGDDGAVLFVDEDQAAATLPQTLRSWCGVPAAVVPEGAAASVDVDGLAAAWAAAGRTLWLVSSTPSEGAVELGPVSSDRFLRDTLTEPPGDYAFFELRAFAVRAGGG